jgi:trans-2,3-dihydro-3-hydroxyanthranilate isomerase
MVRYEIVNMFADKPFAGSALGVVPEAATLSDDELQAIARELGTQETAFVLPPSTMDASYRVRIFMPSKETPFGGHSVLGTAATLVRLGVIEAGPVVQECGPRLHSVAAGPDQATLTCHQPVAAQEVDVALLTAAAGLGPADVLDGPARTAGFGPAFHFLPIRPDAVPRARADLELMAEYGLLDVFAFSWDAVDRVATARLFAPGYGMPEDPACASVALGLGEWLVAAGRLPASDGTHDFLIRQRIEDGRTGVLLSSVTVASGRVTSASTTARVIPVARGEIG